MDVNGQVKDGLPVRVLKQKPTWGPDTSVGLCSLTVLSVRPDLGVLKDMLCSMVLMLYQQQDLCLDKQSLTSASVTFKSDTHS